MKITSINKWASMLLLLVDVIFLAQVYAADGLIGNSTEGATVSMAVLDSTEQLNKGIAAYNRGDYAVAFRLFRNISVLGEPEVHYRLGLMYADGLGTRKSLNLAAYWLRLAAKQNYPGAAEALSALKSTDISG